jgi:hypothetical protein
LRNERARTRFDIDVLGHSGGDEPQRILRLSGAVRLAEHLLAVASEPMPLPTIPGWLNGVRGPRGGPQRRRVAIPGPSADAVGEDPQPCTGRSAGCWRSRPSWPSRSTGPTADLLNLEVDLLFFDTTSTYFERDEPDPETVDEDGMTRPAFRTSALP